MPRAVVCGICGRAGSLVAEALAGAPDIELVGGVESPEHERVGTPLRDLWTSAGDGVVSGSLGSLRPGALDVLVDFSVPEQAVRCAEAATRTGAALVSATTGLSDSEAEAVRSAASSVPVVVAPNTSVGAGVFLALLERAASALGDEFDVELIEAHHRGKRDAPSGTALRATEVIAAARGERRGARVVTGRSGKTGPRPRGEIGVHSVRGGAVAGRHTAYFMSEFETLSVGHVAHSRRAFAAGAVLAVRFAAASEPGLYDMLDVLGLRVSDSKGGVAQGRT